MRISDGGVTHSRRGALVRGAPARIPPASPAPHERRARVRKVAPPTGQCVNPGLADTMRQIGVIYSQPKISYTHYPLLPSDDWNRRYPNELNPDPQHPAITLSPLVPSGGGRRGP